MYVPDWKMIGTDPAVSTVTTGEGEATVLIAIDTHRYEEMSTCHRIRRRLHHDTSAMNVHHQGVAIVIAHLRLNMFPCLGRRPSIGRGPTHGVMSRPTKG
jgi:hypothetical protein